MKEIIVLGGANGSGKSTLATLLLPQIGYPFLNADEIEKELQQTFFQGNTHLQAGRILFERLTVARQTGQSIVLESTLSGKTLLPLLREFRADGYRIRIVYIFLESPELCIARIRVRVTKGGHSVTDEDVKRRYYRSIQNFWTRYRSLADEWTIYWNTDNHPILAATGETDQTISILNTHSFQTFQTFI